MYKPKLEELKLKSFKLLNKGAADVTFRYVFSAGNDGHEDTINIKRTLPIHQDLLKILNDQKSKILRVKQIDFRLMVTTAEKAGVNNLKELSQIAEGMTSQALMNIQPTGFSIAGEGKQKAVIITYQEIEGNKKIVGGATSRIQLSGNVYGFEEDLTVDIELLEKEVYNYVYKDKHSDSEQTSFKFFQDQLDDYNEDDDIEEEADETTEEETEADTD